MSSVISRLPFSYSSLPAAWRRIADSVNRAITVLQEHEDAVDPHPLYVPKGYGGLDVLTAHVRLNGPIPQVTAAIPGTAYDVVAVGTPVGVTQDLANGRLTLTEGGVWVLSMGLVCEVDGFSANDTAEVALGLYDETAVEPLEIPVTGVVPRYGTYLSLALSGMYEVDPARVGHELSLHWVQIAGPVLSVEQTHLLHFTMHRVG